MFSKLKSTLALNLSNIQGWRTNRKIIVFESDDWGSIRMPSKEAYQKLLSQGIRVDKSKYDRIDCLETKEDLINLFDLLAKFKDAKGNSPIFTFNTVMGNPDFDRIEETHYNQFYNMSLKDSYKYYYGEDNMSLWKEAIENRLIKPQFHAREHLNSTLWLRDLQNNHKETRIAFDNHFFGLKTKTSSKFQNHYLAAYNADNAKDLNLIKNITEDGLKMFEDTFGFKSTSFIACNYTWPRELEQTLQKHGVSILQGQRVQLITNVNQNRKEKEHHYLGQKNELNQIYTVRNVFFEPYENQQIDWVSKSFSEIKNAFFWKKPAIISTHRINYVSSLDEKNRDFSLKQLEKLLNAIILKWPDVEFKTSDTLFNE